MNNENMEKAGSAPARHFHAAIDKQTAHEAPRVRRQTSRLRAISASGPIYQLAGTYNVVPVSCALAVLQELAARALNKNARVVSSAAARVHGEDAYTQWKWRTIYCGCSLSRLAAQERLAFLAQVLEYVRRERNADGIEPVLAAAINAAWPLIPQQELASILALAHSAIQRANFSDHVYCPVVDPGSKTIHFLSPGELKAHTPGEWLAWRRLDPKAWQLWITKSPAGSELIGSPGAPGAGQADGSNPFSTGGWAAGTPAPGGKGSVLDVSGGNGMPATTGPGGVLGRDDAGSSDPFGAGGVFADGLRPNGHSAGLGNNGAGKQTGGVFGSDGSLNGHLPAGIGEGMPDIPAALGGAASPGAAVSGPFGSFDPRQAGGLTGSGAAMGAGGSDSWVSDLEWWYGASLVVRGAVAVGVGGGVGAAIGAAAIGVGGIMISDANNREARELHEKERAEDKQAKAGEGAKPEGKKDDRKEDKQDGKKGDKGTDVNDLPNAPQSGSKSGDVYPDPHGQGTQLPVGDGEGGGRPNTLPDRDGGGGGNPLTMWDESGGGVTPTTVSALVAGPILTGPGLRASVLQIGRNVFRYG
ncbi:MAG: hypothetical protein V4463_15675 [Pseudomonadota bacterium]